MSGEGIGLRLLNYRVNTSPRKYLCGIEDFVRFAVSMYVGASDNGANASESERER